MATQPKVVLVAEDEDLIRQIVAEFLVDLGYVVIQVADAAKALQILRDGRHAVDLLFTDVRMPGTMDGMELARLTTTTWPCVKVLITSGHILPSEAAIPVRSRFIAKPYTCATLDDAINSLLQGAAVTDDIVFDRSSKRRSWAL